MPLNGDLVDLLGFAASAFVFLAFSMKRMLALRVTAIASNVAFIAYGAAAWLPPILILHGALLPLNAVRLVQMQRRVRMVRAAAQVAEEGERFEWLMPYGHLRDFAPGEMLFYKGDPASSLFMIAEGEVLLPEIGVTLGPGAILGEIGLFMEDSRRTASARAVNKIKAVELDEHKVTELYFDNPGFAYGLVRLIVRRLAEDVQRAEALAGLPVDGAGEGHPARRDGMEVSA